MALVVQKYGGSSVAEPELVKKVARRVAGCYEEGNQVVVVVSAPGDMTDELIALARRVSSNPPPREMDMLLSTGEQISIALLAMAIRDLGFPVVSLTGAQVGIVTDGVHTKAKILDVQLERLQKELSEGRIVVVAGFQGVTEENEITTLGRGGSDTTAVALAAALEADICEIYTDVEGVYTADPRVVPEARKLSCVSYDTMLELASLGAKVLQPRSVEYARQHNVRLHVRSSFSPDPGTIVEGEAVMEKSRPVSGVTYDTNVAKLAIFDVPDRPGIAYRLFSALAEKHINVDMIIQSAMREDRNDISFTVAREDMLPAVEVLEQVNREIGAGGIAYQSGVAKVSIVGTGMITNPGVAAAMFGALAGENINIQMISTSEIKVSCVIDEREVERAVRAIHRAFRLGEEETSRSPD